MQKIDRLGWAAGITYRAYGVRVGIRASDPCILPQLRDLAPPYWRRSRAEVVDYLYSLVVGGPGPRPGLRRYNLLYGGSMQLSRSLDIDQVLERLSGDMQLYVADHARGWVFVHAGVVGWKGTAILIPAPTFSGKSTLVQALVRAGATYYSDEYAVLDERGWVHPYPRPLHLRNGDDWRGTSIPAAGLGGAGT